MEPQYQERPAAGIETIEALIERFMDARVVVDHRVGKMSVGDRVQVVVVEDLRTTTESLQVV